MHTTTSPTGSTAATGTRRRSRTTAAVWLLARKVGDRHQEWRLLGELSWCLARTGRWDEGLAAADEIPDDQHSTGR